MSKELISRAAVISLIDALGYVNVMNKNDFKSNCRMDQVRQAVIELPKTSEKMAEVQIIRAVINSGQGENIISEKNVISYPFLILSDAKDFSLEKAVKEAVKDYLKTEEGKALKNHLNDRFNWFDFIELVSADLCKPHGFLPIRPTKADIWVDFNEDLKKE